MFYSGGMKLGSITTLDSFGLELSQGNDTGKERLLSVGSGGYGCCGGGGLYLLIWLRCSSSGLWWAIDSWAVTGTGPSYLFRTLILASGCVKRPSRRTGSAG